jgi:hypothetical protein
LGHTILDELAAWRWVLKLEMGLSNREQCSSDSDSGRAHDGLGSFLKMRWG